MALCVCMCVCVRRVCVGRQLTECSVECVCLFSFPGMKNFR